MTENTDQKDTERTGTTDQDDPERYESGQLREKPEVTDEHKERAKEVAESYIEERPTTVLPGSDNTVTGTAVNDWVDDDGNPVHGKDKADADKAGAKDDENQG